MRRTIQQLIVQTKQSGLAARVYHNQTEAVAELRAIYIANNSETVDANVSIFFDQTSNLALARETEVAAKTTLRFVPAELYVNPGRGVYMTSTSPNILVAHISIEEA